MPESNCPSREELSAFLAGRLNEPAIERVADHLERCAPCREIVDTLDVPGDTLASQLRIPAAAQPMAIPAACERAMAAAEKLLDDSSSADAETNLNLRAIVRIRDYRIMEKLGQGGMGAVYKAIHERLERIVAIKVLTPDRLRDSQGVSRFQREMKAVGKLQHPNIVSAHDAGEADGTHFLVMEYVEGMDLGALVSRLGPLPVADACELIRQAALGLQHVHQHGLVHRDIKPSNLMLTTAGQVKILDLGLALLHDPQQPAGAELTATSQLMGTADYVSPEQAENTHGVDIRADLYSLGCTLYKLLTGTAPFSGKEFDTPLKKIMAHVQRTPPAIAGRRADLPAGLAAVLDRLLSKDPANRYATPAEVAAALAPYATGCDVARLAARAVSHPAAVPHRRDAPLPPDATTRVNLSSALVETDTGKHAKPQAAWETWWRDRRVQIAAGGLAALLLVYGIVLIVQTPAGTIVLTMDQPEIAGAEVTVDGQKMITIRTGVGDEPIIVTADEKEHLLKVTKGGFETFTQKFTVRKGNNPPIEVRLMPADAKVVVSETGPSSDKSNEPADSVRQPAKNIAQPSAPNEPDQVVDLLKLVNIERDAVHGIWTISSSGLAVDGKASYARVKVPYAPPAEYDFRIEFTAQGGNDILQLFTAGGRSCTFLMGAWGGRHDGFDTVKDHPLTREGTNIIGGPTSVRRGERHTSVVQVRRDFIAATIDGKLVVRHATNGSDLGIPGPWSIGPSAIGLGSTYDPVIFHKVELVVPAATTAGWHGWPSHAPQPAIVPFDAARARQHQETWATHLEVPVESENSIGMKFRLIPPGEFVMGRSPRDDEMVRLENLAHDDLPPHGVTLTKPFAIGMTEVTQKQWKEVMGTTPWRGKKMAVDDESRPATYVSWFDAERFCRKLSERDGETYRLPTEAEWEFACRGGTNTSFSFGDNVSYLPDYAWIRGNSQDLPHPVATKKPNPWGLFDMHGNAWEWCDARFVPYSAAAVVDPQSEGDVTFRPLRGGCFWSVPAGDYRSSVRRRWPEGLGYPESGFRVVRAVRKAQ